MKRSIKLTLGILLAVATTIALLSSPSKGAKDLGPKKLVLSSDNTIILNDAIEGDSVADVITKAKELDNSGLSAKLGLKKDSIHLFLRTPGGEIQKGLEMLEALKGLKRPVDTVTMFAASMGFQTVQGLGKRYIVKNGVLMSHRARGGFEGEFGGQRPSQVDSRKGFWERRMDEMDQETVDRSKGKQTLASYQKAYASELWVTGSQAVEQGYADEVVNIQCDNSLAGVTTKKINFMGLITILYDVDNCPLNSTLMNIRVEFVTNKGVKSKTQFLAEGGEFGTSCLVAAGKDDKKLCASDSTLTLEKLDQYSNKFKTQYENIQDRIIPYGI